MRKKKTKTSEKEKENGKKKREKKKRRGVIEGDSHGQKAQTHRAHHESSLPLCSVASAEHPVIIIVIRHHLDQCHYSCFCKSRLFQSQVQIRRPETLARRPQSSRQLTRGGM